MIVPLGFAFSFALVAIVLMVVLVATRDRFAASKAYLAVLDIVSYFLTSLTLLVGLFAAQEQISRAFFEEFGDHSLEFGDDRASLRFAAELFCPEAPECADIRHEVTKTLGRGSSPTQVALPETLPAPVARAAVAYNSALELRWEGQKRVFTNPVLWFSVVLFSGFLVGLWRRYLVLRSELAGSSPPKR